MKNSILLALVFCITAPPALAGDAPDAPVDFFVDDYFQAYQTGDLNKLRSLIHPDSLKCIDKVSPDYFKQELSLSRHDNEPAGAPTWKDVDMAPLRALPEFAQFPVIPTRAIRISWQEGAALKVHTIVRMVALAEDGAEYIEVLVCPNAEQIKKRNAFFARRAKD